MPEGDTVWLACARLHRALAGRALTRFELRVPRYATADLTGRAVDSVVARGKHILVRVEGGTTLHCHLRMDGRWRLERPGTRWRGGPGHQVRAVLANADMVAVGYRLHDVRLVPTTAEHLLVGHLGPDVLGPDWAPDEAVRRLASDPARPVGEALLDQRALAGVGTLYRAESLFLRGVSPWTPAGRVTDLPALVDIVHRLMRANRDHDWQATTGMLRPGSTTWVFERAGRPCRRCGDGVRVADQGRAPYGRPSYWCPTCQPGPGPERTD
ncbi:MAG TPA: DNA-formamidopyrimidine glycosylase family protein [Mycobacteriales bacterium]